VHACVRACVCVCVCCYILKSIRGAEINEQGVRRREKSDVSPLA